MAFWEPFQLGYVDRNAKLDRSHRIWEKLLDAFFLIDLAVNMNTGFVTNDGETVMDPKRARGHYMQTWFPIDLVSSIPPVLDYIFFWAMRPAYLLKPWANPKGGSGASGGIAMARLLKIGKVLKDRLYVRIEARKLLLNRLMATFMSMVCRLHLL